MSAGSGVEVDPHVTTLFNEIKLRSTHSYVVLKITDDKKKIVVETRGAPYDHPSNCTQAENEERYNEMKDGLGLEPRYILFDFRFPLADGRHLQKLAFIVWSNDDGPIGKKMIYASSKDALKKKFEGVGREIQCNDTGDLQFSEVIKEVIRRA